MDDARRPLKSRSTAWAQALARAIARTAATPNQISLLSIGFALLGASALLLSVNVVTLVLCAVCVQLRLLCNLIDGMVAVEGGKGTPSGALYNEVPDRIADSLFLVALGYAAGYPWAGWLAALLAALTAYIRVLGGALGQRQDFRGPQAKPQRMAVMTLGLLAAALELGYQGTAYSLPMALAMIVLGSAWTCWRRLVALNRLLNA